MKILVVEDEWDLNRVLVKHLKRQGYSVDSCYNGEEALDYVQVARYDAIVLDIMMPKMDGMTFLSRIRQQGNATPVLLLTAKDTLEDKISGLDSGADDYLTKPFEVGELLARLRVMIRRQSVTLATNMLVIDDLELNITTQQVKRAGVEIDLTMKEYAILAYLMQHQGHIISRDQLLEHTWDFGYEGASNIVDVMIKNIRKKIDVNNSKPLIHTKRGVGYVIKLNEKD